MRNKKVPLRKCVSCKEGKPKEELIRVVRTPDGDVEIDETGKLNGRGAYVCKSEECIDDAINNRKLGRHLKVDINQELYAELKNRI